VDSRTSTISNFQIGANGTLEFEKGVDDRARTRKVDFISTSGILQFPITADHPVIDDFKPTIVGFNGNDRIRLLGVDDIRTLSYNPGTHVLTVKDGAGNVVAQFTFAGTYKQNDFIAGLNGLGGYDIVLSTTSAAYQATWNGPGNWSSTPVDWSSFTPPGPT